MLVEIFKENSQNVPGLKHLWIQLKSLKFSLMQ